MQAHLVEVDIFYPFFKIPTERSRTTFLEERVIINETFYGESPYGVPVVLC